MIALRISALLSILFTGLIAGFFYAWVCSTMWGLDTLPPDAAIQAMNAMNISVRNAVFFPTFFLTPIILFASGLVALFLKVRGAGFAFIMASAIYFLGAFAPTAIVNVPMNTALEAINVPANIETAHEIWTDYSGRWQFWNQFRAVVSGIALVVAGWGLLKIPNSTV